MENTVFRFGRTPGGSYTATCGGASIAVEKSFGTMNWRWLLTAMDGKGRPAASRGGNIRAVDAQAAQEKSLEDAFRILDGLMETGEDGGRMLGPDEASALQDAWELLDGCRCVPA